MNRVLYEVNAAIHDPSVTDAWRQWMLHEHIADVVAAGADSGRLVCLDYHSLATEAPGHLAPTRFAAQYEFASREALERYLDEHAPRLRAEGAKRFTSDAVTYTRRIGTIAEA